MISSRCAFFCCVFCSLWGGYVVFDLAGTAACVASPTWSWYPEQRREHACMHVCVRACVSCVRVKTAVDCSTTQAWVYDCVDASVCVCGCISLFPLSLFIFPSLAMPPLSDLKTDLASVTWGFIHSYVSDTT